MNLSNSITFFHAQHMYQKDGFTDIFRNLPRPISSIGIVIDGTWEYREYRHGYPEQTGVANVGDMLFVPMGSTYDGFWHGDTVHLFSCHFELDPIDIFGSNCSTVQTFSSKLIEQASEDESFRMIDEFKTIERVYQRVANDPHGKDKYELIWRFDRILCLAHSCLRKYDFPAVDAVLEPAFKYLRENYIKQCSVPLLAKMCNLSDSHFYAKFKRATGVTPIEYKNRLMISNAQRMLSDNPEMTIEELSERSGFSTSAYFRRVFKEIAKCSPREFRKREQGLL